MKIVLAWIAVLLACLPLSFAWADGRDIGAISTAFKLLGPNHKIVVSAFNDPKVNGITCYVARPKTGGLKGAVGLAEDPSIASVSCVQTGPISFTAEIAGDENGEEVFSERRSIIFKSLNINRLYDKENGSLVYVVRTHRIIEGSPTTSLSVVAPMAWNGVAPQLPNVSKAMAPHPFTVILNKGGLLEEKEKLAAVIAEAFGSAVEIIIVPRGDQLEKIADDVALKAKANGSILVAAGGDGTVNTVAGICHKHGVTLGVIPLGTFNYFAREFGIPVDIAQAVSVIMTGAARAVSIGLVQDRVFLNNASFGLYTKLIRQREEASSRFGRVRIIAAFAAAYSLLHGQKVFSINTHADGKGESHVTSMVFIGNNTLQLENLGLEAADCTKQDKLAVIIMKKATRLQVAGFVFRGMIKNLKNESQLESFCADNFEVTSRRKVIDMVIDGEIIRCATPLHFRVIKDGLRVMTPIQGGA